MNIKKIILIYYIIIILVIIFVFSIIFLEFKNNNLEIYILDVGQGDSILIKTPQKQNILIDGGNDNKVIYRLGEYLNFYDRRIDLLVLTHPDSDHLVGLNEVLERHEVKNILLTNAVHDSALYDYFIELILRHKIHVIFADELDSILVEDEVFFEVIYPFESLSGQSVKHANDTSIVLRLIYNNFSALFTGDTVRRIEKELLAKNTKLRSDVLKIAHHGSETSSDYEFIKAVLPEVALVSAGIDNKFGHPRESILKRFESLKIPVLSTIESGTIKIFSNGVDFWRDL